MTLTLLALFMLPVLFKMVLDPQGMHRIMKDWGKSEGLQFFSTILLLSFALLILTTTIPSFKWNWESLLTWLAILTAIKGISHLFPSVVRWKTKLVTEERMPIFGFLGMLAALALVYIDTQVLL